MTSQNLTPLLLEWAEERSWAVQKYVLDEENLQSVLKRIELCQGFIDEAFLKTYFEYNLTGDLTLWIVKKRQDQRKKQTVGFMIMAQKYKPHSKNNFTPQAASFEAHKVSDLLVICAQGQPGVGKFLVLLALTQARSGGLFTQVGHIFKEYQLVQEDLSASEKEERLITVPGQVYLVQRPLLSAAALHIYEKLGFEELQVVDKEGHYYLSQFFFFLKRISKSELERHLAELSQVVPVSGSRKQNHQFLAQEQLKHALETHELAYDKALLEQDQLLNVESVELEDYSMLPYAGVPMIGDEYLKLMDDADFFLPPGPDVLQTNLEQIPLPLLPQAEVDVDVEAHKPYHKASGADAMLPLEDASTTLDERDYFEEEEETESDQSDSERKRDRNRNKRKHKHKEKEKRKQKDKKKEREAESGRVHSGRTETGRAGTGRAGALSCKDCGKSFTRTDNLKRHIQKVHEKITELKCPDCNYSTDRSLDLEIHRNRKHRGPIACKVESTQRMRNCSVKPYPCSFCHKRFSSLSDTYRHQRKKHNWHNEQLT